MAFGGGEVDEAAFAQQIDLAAVLHGVLFDEVAGGALGGSHLLERRDVDFDVEVSRVRNDRAVFHDLEVLFREHILVAGDGAEDVADLGGVDHRHHAEAIHDGFERFRRIDFGDDDFCASATRATRKTATTPSVACNDELGSSEEEVGGTDDAIDGGLSGAVAVVEEVLGVGVVDGDDGIAQHSLLGHRAQADHAGGCFFRAADDAVEDIGALGVQDADEVGAVVHGDLRLVINRGDDVLIVGLVVLALDGEDRDVVVAHEAGGDVILGGERVGGAEHHVGAAVAQADGQVRGFGGDVQAGGDAHALQRLILDEFLANDLQDVHGLVGPLDPLFPQIGEIEILHVAVNLCRCRRHTSPIDDDGQMLNAASEC